MYCRQLSVRVTLALLAIFILAAGASSARAQDTTTAPPRDSASVPRRDSASMPRRDSSSVDSAARLKAVTIVATPAGLNSCDSS